MQRSPLTAKTPAAAELIRGPAGRSRHSFKRRRNWRTMGSAHRSRRNALEFNRSPSFIISSMINHFDRVDLFSGRTLSARVLLAFLGRDPSDESAGNRSAVARLKSRANPHNCFARRVFSRKSLDLEGNELQNFRLGRARRANWALARCGVRSLCHRRPKKGDTILANILVLGQRLLLLRVSPLRTSLRIPISLLCDRLLFRRRFPFHGGSFRTRRDR